MLQENDPMLSTFDPFTKTFHYRLFQETRQKRYEEMRYKAKVLIWSVRLLREEIPITTEPPKDRSLSLDYRSTHLLILRVYKEEIKWQERREEHQRRINEWQIEAKRRTSLRVLPKSAKSWTKIIIWVIVIMLLLWLPKHIVRFLKWVFCFLKWGWNNFIQLINEIKSLFKNNEKNDLKEKPQIPKNKKKPISKTALPKKPKE